MTTSSPSAAPNIVIPWLATGLGLAALAAMPSTDPTDPAAAIDVPWTVAEADPAQATIIDGLATPSIVNPLILDVNRRLGALSVDHLPPGVPVPPAVDVESIPAPAQIDHLFAVSGTPVRSLPLPLREVIDEAEVLLPSAADWAALRWCESRGDYTATNYSGKYRGAYQFDQLTWESVGGRGDPAAATAAEQDAHALELFLRRGSAPWPYCGKYLD